MTTPEEWDRFFTKLAERGIISEACAASGVSRSSFYEHKERAEGKDASPESLAWLARFKEAREVAMDRLESEAFRRAHDGVEEFEIGRVGEDEDGILRHEDGSPIIKKRYSDGLLTLLLKAHRPEKFKDRTSQEISGPGGKPIQTESKIIAVPAIPEGSEE